MRDRFEFGDKVVFISGAASGIGAAAAVAFLQAGADVVGGDVDSDALAAFAQTMRDAERERFHPVQLDVTQTDSVEHAIQQAVAVRGHLDVLFNNAGIAPVGSALETNDEKWRTVMSVDLDGVFRVARAALPALIDAGGVIVNTGSVSGTGADYNYTAYNAAKGAVVNLTRSLAVDFGKRGVRVNAIAPGPVRTPMLVRNLTALPGLEQAFQKFIPLGRIAEAEEVASAVLFLASSSASFITGAILPVDGGVTAWNGQPNGDFIA